MSFILAILGVIAVFSVGIIGVIMLYYVIDDILCCDQHENKERRI